MSEENYDSDSQKIGAAIQHYDSPTKMVNVSIRNRVEARIREHTKQIEHLEKIKKLLDENPAIEQFQDLISKVHL